MIFYERVFRVPGLKQSLTVYDVAAAVRGMFT